MISHTLHPAHIQLSKECDYLIFCFADFAIIELTGKMSVLLCIHNVWQVYMNIFKSNRTFPQRIKVSVPLIKDLIIKSDLWSAPKNLISLEFDLWPIPSNSMSLHLCSDIYLSEWIKGLILIGLSSYMSYLSPL